MRHPVTGTALVCLAAVACGGGGDNAADSSPGPTSPATTSAAPTGPPVKLAGTVTDHGTKDLSGDGELELELDDFYFGPTFIKAAPGATVKVELRNEGSAPHTFTVDALKIDKTVAAGEDASVSVKLPASGALAFYCRFHKGQGMQGAFFFTAGATAGASGGSDDGGAYGQ
jgi:plastocyanin